MVFITDTSVIVEIMSDPFVTVMAAVDVFARSACVSRQGILRDSFNVNIEVSVTSTCMTTATTGGLSGKNITRIYFYNVDANLKMTKICTILYNNPK